MANRPICIASLNEGTEANPSFAYNPANTRIDLFGLDPYPVQTQFGGANYSNIGAAVRTAEANGIAQSQIVPVYHAFGGGGYASYILPTASEEQTLLSTWGSLTPTPAFDYAYSWGTQNGDTALVNNSALRDVFAAHNGASPSPTPTPVPTPTPAPIPTPDPTPGGSTLTAIDQSGVSANVPLLSSGSSSTAVGSGTVTQSVASGVDTLSFRGISSETLQLGSGTQSMKFIRPGALSVTGGSGVDTVTATAGRNNFTAGTGTLDVTGGSGRDAYVFHANSGLLKIEDFSLGKHDSLTVDRSLQSSLQQASDGHGGVMLSFGTPGQGIDLVGVSSFATSNIHFA